MGISTFKTGLTGLMGKFLTKLNPEDQADIEAENNPGSTQARYDAMKDKVRTHDKDGNINPPTQMGTPLYQNQNQPTKGNYENPAFISRGNAFNEGAKTLLETSLNHFTNRDKEKAASNKADRQAKRSDRKTNRANARVARQDEKFEAGTSRSNKNAYGLLGQLPKSVKKSRYEKKTEKLRDDSVTLSTKSNASQLVADNLKKIREGDNTTSKLFSFKNMISDISSIPKPLYEPYKGGLFPTTKKPIK
jgi:hypothetical protein